MPAPPDQAQRHAELKRLFLSAIELDPERRTRLVEETRAVDDHLGDDLASLLTHCLPSELPGRIEPN